MPQPIPKFIQVFHREEPKIDDVRALLIDKYNAGGVDMEADHKLRNPNAKRTLMFISADMMIMSKTKAKINSDREATGNWIYCGNDWYVRKLGDEYQYARYMCYNTETKKTIGTWNQAKYDKENTIKSKKNK